MRKSIFQQGLQMNNFDEMAAALAHHFGFCLPKSLISWTMAFGKLRTDGIVQSFSKGGCAMIARNVSKRVCSGVSLVVLAVFIAGCFSKKQPIPEALAFQANVAEVQRVNEPPPVRAPEEYAIKSTADAFVNRDASGKPLSVVVRLYQLKGINGFSRLSFDAVARGQSEAVLFPGEWVATNEMVLIPGATQAFTDKLLPETQYIGGVAFFRSPGAQGWRFIVDARIVRNEGLNFTAKDCYFTLIQPEPEPLSGQTTGNAPECTGTFPH
jgi:type VI secretion system protein VasD